ncbi:hypothetical protein Poli38472_010508 [Pythium oligandrum]|uniref:PH domain-containing protein n=1 Tax=Pythium oligandrum TaxID=41045 RepID=A0A8K1C355_PYTOL|nr:hypothetical protein Poli38472_010508 [Pythium oligandrum]|eukprot:TMW55626.1 hypothetical protein Poli38472_010508 [Pythium oligandrum]
MNHRSAPNTRSNNGAGGGGSLPGNSSNAMINMDLELLVQSTQNLAISFGRKNSLEKFHGWLWKKSSRFSKWRNQHFVLDGGLLSYYDSFPTGQFVTGNPMSAMSGDTLFTCKGESSPAGAVRVAHVERSRKSKIAFKVFAVSGKIIDLRAKNEVVCNQWVERLNEAATLAKRQESLNSSTTSTASSTLSIGYSDSELDSLANIVDKSGWLEVGDKKSKRRRYCVLQGSMFTVYENEDPWAVPTSRAYVTQADKYNPSGCEFTLITQAGKTTKNLILKARSQDEMHMWLEALQNAYE